MARRGVRLTVISEDDEHERFSRLVFLELGYKRHDLRFFTSPAGRGAAEKWVRARFAEEVRTFRGKRSFQRIALMIILDADKKTVKHRHFQLAKELKENNIPERSPNEPIVIWIPKRHIETWIAYLLDDGDVNEKDDYKRQVRNRDCRSAVEQFVEYYKHPDDRPDNLPPSLSTAYGELDRLKN